MSLFFKIFPFFEVVFSAPTTAPFIFTLNGNHQLPHRGLRLFPDSPPLFGSWLLLPKALEPSFVPFEVPPTLIHSPYCHSKGCFSIIIPQCFSSCPIFPQVKQKVGNLSYLEDTQHLSPSIFVTYPPLLSGLWMGKSTLTHMNLAWSACHDRLSTSMTLPILPPISHPASSIIYSNGKPQTWTQNGAWVKTKLADDKPFLHQLKSRRLFLKFHGPLLSTHSSWYIELNLNCNTLFPTLTILRSEPIFHADLKVFLRALWFWWRSTNNLPNKLSTHSFGKSGVLFEEMKISYSSSLVSCKFFRL